MSDVRRKASKKEEVGELEKLGGLESALTIVLNEDQEDILRETAALAIANASRQDEEVCCQVISREVRQFRRIVELLWDDNATVGRSCLRVLCNCTFIDLEAGGAGSSRKSVRALMGRFLQETDWITSLVSLLKSDPFAKKDPGQITLTLNSLANLALEFVTAKAEIAKHGSLQLITNLLRSRTPPVVLEAALNALINCLDSLPKNVKAFQISCGFTRAQGLLQAYLDSLRGETAAGPQTTKASSTPPPADLVLILLYQCFKQGDLSLCQDVCQLGLIRMLAEALHKHCSSSAEESDMHTHTHTHTTTTTTTTPAVGHTRLRLPVRVRDLMLKCLVHFLDRVKLLSKTAGDSRGGFSGPVVRAQSAARVRENNAQHPGSLTATKNLTRTQSARGRPAPQPTEEGSRGDAREQYQLKPHNATQPAELNLDVVLKQQLWTAGCLGVGHTLLADPAAPSAIRDVAKKLLLHLRKGFSGRLGASTNCDVVFFLRYGAVQFLAQVMKCAVDKEASTFSKSAPLTSSTSTALEPRRQQKEVANTETGKMSRARKATEAAAAVELSATIDNACFVDDTLQWMQSHVTSPTAMTAIISTLSLPVRLPTLLQENEPAAGQSTILLSHALNIFCGLVQLCCYRSPPDRKDWPENIGAVIAERNGASAGCARVLGKFLSRGILDHVLLPFVQQRADNGNNLSSSSSVTVSWQTTAASAAKKAGVRLIGKSTTAAGAPHETDVAKDWRVPQFERFVLELTAVQQAVLPRETGAAAIVGNLLKGNNNNHHNGHTKSAPTSASAEGADDVTFVVHQSDMSQLLLSADAQQTPQLAARCREAASTTLAAEEPQYFVGHKDRLQSHAFFQELLKHAEEGSGHVQIHGIPYGAFCGVVAFVYDDDLDQAVKVAWDQRSAGSRVVCYAQLRDAAGRLGCPRLQRFCTQKLLAWKLSDAINDTKSSSPRDAADCLLVALQPDLLPVAVATFEYLNESRQNVQLFLEHLWSQPEDAQCRVLLALGAVTAMILRRTWV